MDEMLVDVWDWSVDHEGYYTACQPEECRYTMIVKNGVIYIVTTLIGSGWWTGDSIEADRACIGWVRQTETKPTNIVVTSVIR